MIIYSFLFFLAIFIAIGMLSVIQKQKTASDYLLAGRSIKPWLVALAAVATNNSGYMFIGLIGYAYNFGLSAMWLMTGWILGDFAASLKFHKKIRATSKNKEVLSFAGVISNWSGGESKKLRFICGLIVVIFLGVYAAAQLSAGSKALHVLFDWNYSTGALIGAIMVVIYCFVGGIRASIWTNAAQSFAMIIAMSLMMFAALQKIGGIDEMCARLAEIDPNYLKIVPQNIKFGIFGLLAFIFSWFMAGIGVIGQPHIMLSFMTMDKPQNIGRVRLYYYSWYIAFTFFAIMAGLASRILIPEVGSFDPELALPQMAINLLPEFLVGLVLAGLFAATMSTADSQIISCSAALTRDLTGGRKVGYFTTKLATILVAAIALLISLYGSKSVFVLVLIAWSALASAFTPIIILHSFKVKLKEFESIIIVLGGLLSAIFWQAAGLGDLFYGAAPGIFAGFVIYFLLKAMRN